MIRTLLKTMIALPLALCASVETWLWMQRNGDNWDTWQDDIVEGDE